MFACFYICLNGPIQQSPAIGLTARTMYCTSLSCICLAEASLADSMRYQSFLQYRILPRFTVPALRPSRSLLLWVCFRRGGVTPLMLACLLTVFRLTLSILAISDLERPAASIDRISFTVSRGTVISSILPGRARQSNRPGKPYGEGRAPGPRGAALLLKLLNFSCSRCLFPSDHSDHFLVNINIQGRLRRDRRQPLERRARGRG